MRRAALIGAVVALAAAVPAGSALAASSAPSLHAHRGGSFVGGKKAFAENTLPAFRASAKAGFVLELDIGVTADGVPVVLHDQTLDRTTTCFGALNLLTLEQLKGCPSDILGSPGSVLGFVTNGPPTPVPTLVDVLALAKKTGATVNAEIKDFDTDNSRANQALDVLAANPLPRGRLIIQSFFPPNLALAKQRLRGVQTSRLTLKATNDQGLLDAAKAKDAWILPQWPVSAAYVRRAHKAGLKVVPYTLDRRSEVRAARKAGVDALITDDPSAAKRWLRNKS